MRLSKNTLSRVYLTSFFRRLFDDNRIEIDNSTYGYWQGCLAKGLFAGALRLESVKTAEPLKFGGAIHKGLELRYRGHSLKAQLEAAEADATKTGLINSCDPKRNITNLRTCLQHYHVDCEAGIDTFKPVELNGKLLVEQPFSVPLGTITIHTSEGDRKIEVWWQGRLDMLTWHTANSIWVVDHKTTTVMGEKFADDLYRSSQMLGYMFAARAIMGAIGRTVQGVIINAIALRSSGFEFKRFELPYNDWQIDEWVSEALLGVAEIAQQLYWISVGADEISCNRTHCVTKYGKCPFFDVCQMHPSVRETTLFDTAQFQVSTWSPLE